MVNNSYWLTNYKIVLEDGPKNRDERVANLIYLAHEKGFVEWKDIDNTGMRRRGILKSGKHEIYIFILYDANYESDSKPCFRITINTPYSNVLPDHRTAFYLGTDEFITILRMFVDKVQFKEKERVISCVEGCAPGHF